MSLSNNLFIWSSQILRKLSNDKTTASLDKSKIFGYQYGADVWTRVLGEYLDLPLFGYLAAVNLQRFNYRAHPCVVWWCRPRLSACRTTSLLYAPLSRTHRASSHGREKKWLFKAACPYFYVAYAVVVVVQHVDCGDVWVFIPTWVKWVVVECIPLSHNTLRAFFYYTLRV